MRSEVIRAANIIAILLLVGLNSNALPFLETPTVSEKEWSRIQETLQASATTLSGRVYEGDFRDESKPFANVRVELCCSNDQKNRGRVVESATTDAKGWYELVLPSGCEFYDIVVTVPQGYIAAGADSVGGDVIDDTWIQYDYPLDRSILTGNKFWIKKQVLETPLIPIRPLVPVTPQEPETVSCPKGCTCMTEERAKEVFGKYERCSPEICGYDGQRRPMYCFRPVEDVPPEPECPKGCECMTEEMAKQEFGKYERCSPEICGYNEQRMPMYCFRPVEDVPEESKCPEGCACMTEERAKEVLGKYERCSPEICGYDELRRPMYCFRPVEDVPPEAECPEGCECLEEEVAAEKFGGYEWCSDKVCGLSDAGAAKYCFRPAEPTPEVPPESCEFYFSTEEDFIAQGPIPQDGNPIISDGDLLGPGCIVFARNRELLAAFKADTDLGLDAVDVIDAEGHLVAFSTELNDPLGRFSAGDLLATNGLVIPNGALLAEFDVLRVDLGLDAVHFVGDLEDIKRFLDRSSQMSRDDWLKNPDLLPEMLREYGVDIWFSTEGTPSGIGKPAFLDGDLLSTRDGIMIAPNAVLLAPSVPAGIPDRGVDFGLDAVTAGRDGKRELIRFSTEILYEGEPAFSDGDVILIRDAVTCTNWDLIRCFEPKTSELGLDALSIAARGEPKPQTCHPDLPAPELVVTGKEERFIGGNEFTRYELSVTNWNQYPAELFEAAPDLQPCGTNTEASRTWVDVYDQDGGRIYGFCTLSSPEGLRDLWFAVEGGAVHPKSVYITLTDRRCDAVYVSNQVSIGPSGEETPSPIEIYFADAKESPGSVYRLGTGQPSVKTHSTGSLNISQTWTADLDEGVLGTGQGADIWFHALTEKERYLEPMNGATIAKVAQAGAESCTAATLSSSRIKIDDLPEGSYVCVLTDEGRRSQFRVNVPAGLSPGVLGIGYITWDASAPGTVAGSEETIYTRPSRNLYSFAFHPYVPEKLYYVNANENKIYRSSETYTGWSREEVVYDHDTYVRDLAFDLDRDGDLVLYFSEATGAGADGKIYRIEDDAPVLYRTIVLSDVNGFWAGDFAFGEDGTLYLSSGNRVPASIYKVDEWGVQEIFTDSEEPIKGLAYKDGFLYYANWGTKIYRLDLETIERTTVYSNPERKWLSDVGFRGDTSEDPWTAVL